MGRGVPEPDASAYVRELVRGLSDALVDEPDRELALLASDHATPGGLNEQVRTYVRSHGVHELIGTALDDVARRVAGDPGLTGPDPLVCPMNHRSAARR